jgi:hypothetical protein
MQTLVLLIPERRQLPTPSLPRFAARLATKSASPDSSPSVELAECSPQAPDSSVTPPSARAHKIALRLTVRPTAKELSFEHLRLFPAVIPTSRD